MRMLIRPLLRYSGTPIPRYPGTAASLRSAAGQASSEILFLLPLFVMMAGLALYVGYMCYQGVKVQHAANFAARIQGQERIGGGVSQDSINRLNGLEGAYDEIPDAATLRSLSGKDVPPGRLRRKGLHGVYWKYRTLAGELFYEAPEDKLLFPKPDLGINSDRVRVARILVPPKLFGLQMAPMVLEAEAYGGEDPRMYGLPRWGETGGKTESFYKTQIREKIGP